MQAFKNDPAIKENLIKQLEMHRNADEIVKGIYWENGKGCAIGCTVHDHRHALYKELWDIPVELARLEDTIFEGLRNSLAKEWPLQFIQAIPVGADLSDVWPKFAIWLLTDAERGVLKYSKTDQEKKAIQHVADLYSRYQIVTADEWREASYSAYAYATAHASTAAHASAAVYAAAHAAHAAGDAVYAAGAVAAHAAAYAAANAGIAYAAIAYAVVYEAQSKKLLELMKECK